MFKFICFCKCNLLENYWLIMDYLKVFNMFENIINMYNYKRRRNIVSYDDGKILERFINDIDFFICSCFRCICTFVTYWCNRSLCVRYRVKIFFSVERYVNIIYFINYIKCSVR